MLRGFRLHFNCSHSHFAFTLFMFAVQQAVPFLSVGLVYSKVSMTDSAVDGCIHLADRFGRLFLLVRFAAALPQLDFSLRLILAVVQTNEEKQYSEVAILSEVSHKPMTRMHA